MAANYNKVILMGNLTRDPEFKYTSSSTAMANFGMAINRPYTDPQSGERKDDVCFVDITAFGRTAEICNEYLKKGDPVFLEGSLNFYSWETDAGEKRSKLSVRAYNIQLLPKRTEQPGQYSQRPEVQEPTPTGPQATTAGPPVEETVPAEGRPVEETAPAESEPEAEDDIPF